MIIIHVDNAAQMAKDISELLGISKDALYAQLPAFGCSTLEDRRVAIQYLQMLSENDFNLDKVYFCHLTRSIDCPKTLLPLKTLLTTNNAFSSFLKEFDIEFSIKGECINMIYRGNDVSPRLLYDPYSIKHKHNLLASRLGYCGEKDYCVNGFLFAAEAKKSTDIYYHLLYKSPELIQNLDSFFGLNMSEEYHKRSKYYFALSKLPIDKIIYDGRKSPDAFGTKSQNYVLDCIHFLTDCYYSRVRLNNPKVRIDDYSTLEIDEYIELK